MSELNCQQELRNAGKPYPRTCTVCGLGPCKVNPPARQMSETDQLRAELIRLRAELAAARKDAARLKVRSIAYEDAYRIAYRATRQSHSGHWDKTGQGGRGCPECTRAQEAREQCERVLQEGIKKLAAIAEEKSE